MTRATAREIAVQICFELDFHAGDAEEVLKDRLSNERFTQLKDEVDLYESRPSAKQAAYIRDVVLGVRDHLAEIESDIAAHSHGWSVNRISGIARSVLRVAIFECRYLEDVPQGAAINEAIRILKDYEDPDVVSFVNGILGSIFREEENPE